MKYFLILILSSVVSCGQDYNSNTFDAQIYGSQIGDIDTTTPEGQRFAKAFNVIDTQCISCHNNNHNFYASLTTSQDWISSNLIIKGDFDNSFIIRELKNFGGDMPQGSSELSQQDLDYLRDWIENIP